MKRTVLLFALALLLLDALGLINAQTNSPQTFEQRNREALRQTEIQEKEQADLMRVFIKARGQSWMTNYYNKTLSSLGDIVSIQIDRRTRSTPDWPHRYLWQIIEESKMQVYPEGSLQFGVPPVFTIDYADGLRVQADRCDVLVVLPDGRKGSAYLESKAQ